MRIFKIATLLFFLICITENVLGQSERNKITSAFYPPEMVIQYKEQIKLTDKQEDYIRSVYNEASPVYNNLNLDLKSGYQQLWETVKQEKVDEEKSKQLLQKVLDLENQIKLLQLEVYVKVKNTLTIAQMEKLNDLKK